MLIALRREDGLSRLYGRGSPPDRHTSDSPLAEKRRYLLGLAGLHNPDGSQSGGRREMPTHNLYRRMRSASRHRRSVLAGSAEPSHSRLPSRILGETQARHATTRRLVARRYTLPEPIDRYNPARIRSFARLAWTRCTVPLQFLSRPPCLQYIHAHPYRPADVSRRCGELEEDLLSTKALFIPRSILG